MERVYVNEYEYTEAIADEAQRTFIKNNKSFRFNILICIFLALYGVFMLFKSHGNWFYLVVALLSLAFIAYIFYMQRKVVKKEMAELDELFRGSPTKLIHYELDDELRTYLDDDDEPSYIVEKKDMVGWAESENLILLICRGKAFVPFKKDSFLEGDEEGLRNYLRGMFTKNKMGR